MDNSTVLNLNSSPLITVGGPRAVYQLDASQKMVDKLCACRKKIIELYNSERPGKINNVIKYINKKLSHEDNNVLKLDLLDHRAYLYQQEGAYKSCLVDLSACVQLNYHLQNARPSPRTRRKIFYKPGRLGLDSVDNYKKQIIQTLVKLQDYRQAYRICAELSARQQPQVKKYIHQHAAKEKSPTGRE